METGGDQPSATRFSSPAMGWLSRWNKALLVRTKDGFAAKGLLRSLVHRMEYSGF